MSRDVHGTVRKSLLRNHACYVLITCDEPSDDGELQVKMSYEGDSVLASYLLQGAQDFFDEEGLTTDEGVAG